MPSIPRRISHYTFSIPAPYSAGHPLTPSEAQALNLHRAQLIRNIAARQIEVLERTATVNGILSPAQIEEMQRVIDEISSNFTFTFKDLPTESLLDKERRAVAEEIVRRSTPWNEWAQEGQIEHLLASNDPEVEREARRRLALKQTVLFDETVDPAKLGL